MQVFYPMFPAIIIGSWRICNKKFRVIMNILKIIDLLITPQEEMWQLSWLEIPIK
jgi:hypothetical protein